MDLPEEYVERYSFLVPQLTIEQPLYRYRSCMKYIIDEIKNDHIYLSNIEQLNDPFDSSFAMTYDEALQRKDTFEYFFLRCFFLRDQGWFVEVEQKVAPLLEIVVTLKEFSDILESYIKAAGGYYPATAIATVIYKISSSLTPKRMISGRLACFSETWESPAMWSYYADSHKGVCMKYDFTLLDKDNFAHQTILQSLQKVWYSQKRPVDTNGTYSPFVKGLDWAHEQEWRLFKTSGDPYVSVPCLTEIYLGVNFDVEQVSPIMNAVKTLPREVKVSLLHTKPDTYGFQPIRLY